MFNPITELFLEFMIIVVAVCCLIIYLMPMIVFLFTPARPRSKLIEDEDVLEFSRRRVRKSEIDSTDEDVSVMEINRKGTKKSSLYSPKTKA